MLLFGKWLPYLRRPGSRSKIINMSEIYMFCYPENKVVGNAGLERRDLYTFE